MFRITFIISALCIGTLQADREKNFESALARTKSSGESIIVLIHGSDWNRESGETLKIFLDPRFQSAIGNGPALVAIDRKQSPTMEETELAASNKKGDANVRSLPGLVLYDDQRRLIGSFSGKIEIDEAGGIVPAAKRLIALREKRDEYWKTAEKSKGFQRAGYLGMGLDVLNIGLGPNNAYKSVLDEMRKYDPEDESGYIAKYSFSPDRLISEMLEHAEKKEFDAAEKALDAWQANPRLNLTQKQQVQGARFGLYQRWPEKKPQVKSVLEKMREIDPKSDLGIAAENYLEMLSGKPG